MDSYLATDEEATVDILVKKHFLIKQIFFQTRVVVFCLLLFFFYIGVLGQNELPVSRVGFFFSVKFRNGFVDFEMAPVPPLRFGPQILNIG